MERIEGEGGPFSIKGREARHIARVLRMGPGDRLILMDRAGKRFEAIIESADQKEVRVLLSGSIPSPSAPQVEIVLCQAVLKSQAMDALVQKASELGVASIYPFLSSRTVVRLDERRSLQKARRWQEITEAAAKQSDRHMPPTIYPCMGFLEMMERWRGEPASKVILWEQEAKLDLKSFLRDSAPRPRFIGVVGPEGGFELREIEAAKHAGFLPLSLGGRILRAETAAIAVVALVQYEWGDLCLRIETESR